MGILVLLLQLVLPVDTVPARKLTLLFTHPAVCPCEAFQAITAHPAMQRRLASVDYRTAVSEEPFAVLTLLDPDGNPLVRWTGVPDLQRLLKVLTLVEAAAPHFSEESGARGRALAMLALGEAARGRALLQAMRDARDAEDRQFATLWLEQLDATQEKREPREGVLTELARSGASDAVRFEAWTAVGNLRYEAGRDEEAVEAYRQALGLASASMRGVALASLRKAEGRAASVVGLGAPGAVVIGRRTVQPRMTPKTAASVEYRLDGRLAATAKKVPFAAALRFGSIPRRQVLEVTALDKKGARVGHTSVVVNQRSDEFGVQIVEPADGRLSGTVNVAVAAQVPRGRSMESVVIEWNGAPVARLTSPPYRARVQIPGGEQGMLRAALRLDDGSEVEDVLLANAGTGTLETRVNLVEVPVYFDKPGWNARDLTVREAGQPRAIDRIVHAADAPLRIALVLDASKSMEPHLLDVQEAALRFVDANLEERDRLMMVALSDASRTLWPTNDRQLISRSILSIQPRGATALHDAMVIALLQLQAAGSRRALVVFSDGIDNNSAFSAGDVAEVARRSGVPVYVLLLQPELEHRPRMGRSAVMSDSPHEIVYRAQKELKNLSKYTGGQAFELESLQELPSIWGRIAEDLKRQSLVIYRTAPEGREWRPLEVTLARGGSIRAPSGVWVAASGDEAGAP